MKKWARPIFFWVILIVSVVLFVFLRLYKIKSSFLFFNDPGRDLLALYRWQETSKPPLLGPRTSVLPFNQSALYFYLLYPLFLLTNHSLFSTIYTVIIFYLIFLLAGIFFLKKRSRLLEILVIVWFLIAIHPQFILQHRHVWNPSSPIYPPASSRLEPFLCCPIDYSGIFQFSLALQKVFSAVAFHLFDKHGRGNRPFLLCCSGHGGFFNLGDDKDSQASPPSIFDHGQLPCFSKFTHHFLRIAPQLYSYQAFV